MLTDADRAMLQAITDRRRAEMEAAAPKLVAGPQHVREIVPAVLARLKVRTPHGREA